MIENFINHQITIFLKENRKKLSGILIDFDSDFLIIQAEELLIIPTINISHYSVVSMQKQQVQNSTKIVKNNTLRILIDDVHVANLEVPTEIDILSANQPLLTYIWGSKEVQAALGGKIQKSLHYAPGEVHIITTDIDCVSNENGSDNEFNLNPTASFLQPIDMVHRLQNIGKKRQKENKTEG